MFYWHLMNFRQLGGQLTQEFTLKPKPTILSKID